MENLCVTRAIKNARHLQATAPHILPKEEPEDGFGSRVPNKLLARLHASPPNVEVARVRGLAEALQLHPPPKPRPVAKEPLFNGTLVFAQVAFRTSKGFVSIAPSDLATAMDFTRRAVFPISRYANQYGPNRLDVAPHAVPFSADVASGRYNDRILQGWVNAIVSQNKLPASTGVVILNPPGVVNSDADPSQGVGGYHNFANVPYAFVNATGTGFTVPDDTNIYALALSHEVAEMAVDPRADLVNPEVCDPCVPADAIVLGDDKPISEYAVGDHVVGAGGLQTVSETFVRPFRGDLLEIKALGMLPLRVTPNHPLLVVRGQSHGATVTYGSTGWQPAERVRPKIRFQDGDYLVMPRLDGNVRCTEVSLVPYIQRHRATLKQTGQGAKPDKYPHAETFPLTTGTAWLLGLYVAEGCADPAHRSVEFDLHSREAWIAGLLKEVASELGHKTWVTPTPGEQSIRVHLASQILCRFLPDVCGKGASHKRIPDFILYHEDEDILRAFLDGYMVGDGSTEYTQAGYELASFTTVSRTLALQLQLAYGRLGIFVALRRKRPAQTAMILGRRVRMKETYRGLWCSDRRATRRKRLHRVDGRDAYLLPVKTVSRVSFSGLVHNLETTDHTYLLSNAVTHNCGPNCQQVWIDYFDAGGQYLRALQAFPAFPPPFPYGFFINAMVKPQAATQCPAPGPTCNYAPP